MENTAQGPEVASPEPKVCTATRDRLMAITVINNEMIASTQRVLEIIKAHPENDEDFARVFGVAMK